MRRRLLFSLVLLVLWIKSNAQDIPVDPYTGRAVVNIPLVSVNDRNVTANVGLFYNSTGVRVDDAGGIVGTNFSLIAGGEIRRELRSLPDDLNGDRKGWLYSTKTSQLGTYSFPADGSGLDCTAENTVYNLIKNDYDSIRDSEPDIFHFSGGSISGSFVFDHSGNVKLLPYQDIKVVPHTLNSSLVRFEIITAHGVKYDFAAVETESRTADLRIEAGADSVVRFLKRDYNLGGVSYNVAWKLSSIQSPSGERIDFSYTSIDSDQSIAGNKVEVAIGGQSVTNFHVYSTIITSNQKYWISQISSPHQLVTFEYQPHPNTASRGVLSRIVVNEKTPHGTKYVREIKFGYNDLTPSVVGHNSTQRVFLHEIVAKDECEVYRPIVFEYYGLDWNIGAVSLPNPGSGDQDIWGYALPPSGGGRFPKLYIYPSQSGIHKVSLFQKPGQSDEIVIPGANRLGQTPIDGSLSAVTYPSGGKAFIAYNSHDFYNPITTSTTAGGGLRVSQVRIHDGISHTNDIVKTYEYKKADGSTSGKLLTLPTFWLVTGIYRQSQSNIVPYSSLTNVPLAEQWNKLLVRSDINLNPDFNSLSAVVYERVTEKVSTGKGKTVYEFDVPYVYGAVPSGQDEWSPSYVHVARPGGAGACPPIGLNGPGFYHQPFPPQTPYDFGRGLPKKILWFAEGENDPLREVINEFSEKSVSPTTVKGLWFEYIPYATDSYYFMYGPYKLLTNRDKVLTRTTERIRSRATPYAYMETVTDYTYGATNHSLLTSTTTTKSDGTEAKTKFKYAIDYGSPAGVGQGSPLQVEMIKDLNDSYQWGTLVEQTNSLKPSGGTETTYAGVLYMFDDFDSGSPKMIKPKEVWSLKTSGVQNFTMSAITGSPFNWTFTKDGDYVKRSTLNYKTFGDLVRVEDDKRQLQTFQPDSLTGLAVASIANVEAGEIVFSNFDQHTKFSFVLASAFTTTEKSSTQGRSSYHGLGGWKTETSSTRYLEKSFRKRPSSKYVFSAWYKTPAATGTHIYTIKVRNVSGTELLSDTVHYWNPSANQWYYKEKTLDISGITDAVVKVEVWFSGTASNGAGAALDDVAFAPEAILWTKTSAHTAYGITSATSPDRRVTENEFDLSGKLRYSRDHERNIRQRFTYTGFRAVDESQVPISFSVPTVIYDGVQTTLTASTACVEVTTLQWKVEPKASPGTGTYFTGSTAEPYTFANDGEYTVWLKTTHATYGTYETSKTVTVLRRPLDVSICVQDGPTEFDICQYPAFVMELESCPGGTLASVSMQYTTFTASVSGCTSGTYTYQWQKRPYSSYEEPWENVGSNSSTIQLSNYQGNGYFVRCIVTGSCNRTGTSNTKKVYIIRSAPRCAGPISN